MYILTDYNNVIIAISETLEYQSNGYPLIKHGTLAIPTQYIKAISEVEEVPSEVKERKYCYTEKNGFYVNENYVEPVDSQEIETRVSLVEERIALTEDAVNSILGF